MTRRYTLSDCPVCGSGSGRTVADPESLRTELETLWDFHMRRLRDGPGLGELTDRVVFTQPLPIRVSECRDCGLLRRDPADAAETVDDRYGAAPVDPVVLARLSEAHLPDERARVRRLTGIAGTPGRGVEVGSYTGAFLEAARDAGWSFEGLDTNPDVVAHLRSRGLHARPGRPEDLADEAGLDAVTLWTCLDQLPNPRSAIRAAARAIRPGGVVAVRVPNGAFYQRVRLRLDGPLRAVAERYLAWNNWLGFPYLLGFTPGSLERLLTQSGLRIVRRAADAPPALTGDETCLWGRVEERAVKRTSRALRPASAPWIEVYARRPDGDRA